MNIKEILIIVGAVLICALAFYLVCQNKIKS